MKKPAVLSFVATLVARWQLLSCMAMCLVTPAAHAAANARRVRAVLFLWLLAAFIPASAQDAWMLASRESGCVGLQLLVKMERLPHAPASPEEFAAMMRARGHAVTTGLPDGFPREMTGKAVMVKYAENRAPVFLRDELCGRVNPP